MKPEEIEINNLKSIMHFAEKYGVDCVDCQEWEKHGSKHARQLDRRLAEEWQKEPMWAALIGQLGMINANRGYNMTGGERLVRRYRNSLHNWYVAPGITSYRAGMMMATVQYYTQCVGACIEIERDKGRFVGLRSMNTLDVQLQDNDERPVKYKRKGSRKLEELETEDVIRFASNYHGDGSGYGMPATLTAMKHIQMLLALYKYEQGEMSEEAVRGILYGGPISMQTVKAIRDKAKEEGRNNEDESWMSNLIPLLSESDTLSLNLLPVSRMPESISDRRQFLDTCAMTYAAIVGVPVGEFWNVDTGSFGEVNKSRLQQQSAITKGEGSIINPFQEALTISGKGFPDTIAFEFTERNDESELLVAQLEQMHFTNAKCMLEVGFTQEAVQSWLVGKGVVDASLTDIEEAITATDTDDGDTDEIDDVQADDTASTDTTTTKYLTSKAREVAFELKSLKVPDKYGEIVTYREYTAVDGVRKNHTVRHGSVLELTRPKYHQVKATLGESGEENVTDDDIEGALEVVQDELLDVYELIMSEAA